MLEEEGQQVVLLSKVRAHSDVRDVAADDAGPDDDDDDDDA